jgi:hypothetical protein
MRAWPGCDDQPMAKFIIGIIVGIILIIWLLAQCVGGLV